MTQRTAFQKRARGAARQHNRGTALVLALALLAIFGILGTSYVRYMNLNSMETDMGVRGARAEHLADAGVQVALEGLRQEVLSPDRHGEKGKPVDFHFTTYDGIDHRGDGITADAMNMPRHAVATVTIHDENTRVNVNHAPARVLEALGIEANAARAIAQATPAGGKNPPLLALDELVTRGLLTQAQYDSLDRSVFTVHSVADPANPTGYINVNEAPPRVLSALLGLSEDQAAQLRARIKDQGPFSSLPALSAAVSEITGEAASGIEQNAALGLKSRCFRVLSEGRYAKIIDWQGYDAAPSGERDMYLRNRASERVEAVIQFRDDGSYEVLHWRTGTELGDTGAA